MGKVAAKKRKRDAETIATRLKHRRIMLEVREEAREFSTGLRRGMDPAEAVQQVLDNIADLYDYATQQVFQLEEGEYWRETLAGKMPNEWIKEMERLGLQMVHVAGKAASMGLAERQIRLQEQQAAIFATVVEAALNEVGLGAEQRRLVHTRIAEKLDDIVGTANELPAAA